MEDYDDLELDYDATNAEAKSKTVIHVTTPSRLYKYYCNWEGRCDATDFAYLLGVSGKYICRNSAKSNWLYSYNDPILRYRDFNGNIKKANENYRRYGIRPVIPNYEKTSISVGFLDDKITFGEFPQEVVNFELQQQLNKNFNNNKLQKTGRKWTVDGTKPCSRRIGFKPHSYEEYEYLGERYIRVLARNNVYFKDGAFFKNEELKVSNNDYVWVKVKPIIWDVDRANNVLVSEKALISGIRASNDELKIFLNNYFINEIVAKPYERKKVDSKISNSVLELLEEIKKYKPAYDGELPIEEKVREVIQTNNEKLDSLLNKPVDGVELTVEHVSPESLKDELIDNLKAILEEAKTFYEKVKSYKKMINLLSSPKVEREVISKYEIYNDIASFRKILETVLNKPARYALEQELDNIIKKYIDYCRSSIDKYKVDPSIETDSFEKLEIMIRKDLQPLLDQLREIMDKQNLVNEVMKITKEKIETLYFETKNEQINKMLNEINERKVWILTYGNNEEKKHLMELLTFKVDFDQDIMTILNILEEVLVNVSKYKLQVEERVNRHDEINSYKVDLDVDKFFGGEEKRR